VAPTICRCVTSSTALMCRRGLPGALYRLVNIRDTRSARPAALANRYGSRFGLREDHPFLAVAALFAQIADVRHRDVRQPLIAGVGECEIIAAEDLLRRRSAQRVVRLVHLRQQRDVGGSVVRGEAPAFASPRSHGSAFGIVSEQASYLRPAQPRHPGYVPPHQSLLLPAQTGVLLSAERSLGPFIEILCPVAFNPTSSLPFRNAWICSTLNRSPSFMLTSNPQHALPLVQAHPALETHCLFRLIWR